MLSSFQRGRVWLLAFLAVLCVSQIIIIIAKNRMSDSPTITIISGDGVEFKLNREAALASPVLSVMIEG